LKTFRRTTANHEISHYLGAVTIFQHRLTAIGGMYNIERDMEDISPSHMTGQWQKRGTFPIVLASFSTEIFDNKLFVFGGMTCSGRDCPDGRRWAPGFNLYGRWEPSDRIFSYSGRGMLHLNT